MLGTLLMFSWCLFNYDVTFKITNRLKINNKNLKFNDNLKNYITIEKIPKDH